MNPLLQVLLLCSSLLFSFQTARAEQPHSTVQTLTLQNFDDMLADPANGLWFLKFYAPWCGHCKQLAPTLDKVAPYLKGRMAFGKIDCTTEKKLCSRFKVTGYPTLMIHRDGETFPYPKERTADSIIEFGEKMSASAVTESSSYESALELASKGNGVVFVAYDPSTKGETTEEKLQSSTLLQVFGQIARKQQAFASFLLLSANTESEEVAKFGVGNEAFIARIEDDVPSLKYEGTLVDSVDFLSFVEERNVALVTELGSNNYKALSKLGKPLALGVIDPSATETNESFIAELRSVALNAPLEIKSKYNFCYMNGVHWARFLSQFNVDSNALPTFFILDTSKKTFWEQPDPQPEVDHKQLSIQELLEAHSKGKLTPKSQGSGKAKTSWYLNQWIILGVTALAFVIFFFFMPLGDDEMEEINVPEPKMENDDTKKDK